MALAIDWLDRLAPEQFITHRFGLDDCQAALEMAADRQAGAIQVIFEY